uniref:Uncharacterized protein n=1 Tax=Chromera velia CCMP2878 TaxID=1169474 RepID=A0A0G4HME1_9ALVE|eukprot:Cvel_29239.t1-p1 / transcript=Cvel_29239.t1 / gene=Cvel_29239 / organism=Chromera_velia_CCMP2878 / gene_product=Actin-related protein 6, putative / transcript_product=Actin-related protein 6, putative / location=Cvel_scaffold3963:4596-10730(+) / protein_length=603 / sequence_SO=supercontig / SO=protein_coding / is_pseudo=false
MRNCLVIDNGAGSVKAGWAGEEKPRVIVPNCGGRHRTRKAEQIKGEGLLEADDFFLFRPYEGGLLVDWALQGEVWETAFSSQLMNIRGERGEELGLRGCDLLLTEPIGMPSSVASATDEVLFEGCGFDNVAYRSTLEVLPRGLALPRHNGKETLEMAGTEEDFSGRELLAPSLGPSFFENPLTLSVDCGFSFCTVAPMLEGEVIAKGVKRSGVAGGCAIRSFVSLLKRRGEDLTHSPLLAEQIFEESSSVAPSSSDFREFLKVIEGEREREAVFNFKGGVGKGNGNRQRERQEPQGEEFRSPFLKEISLGSGPTRTVESYLRAKQRPPVSLFFPPGLVVEDRQREREAGKAGQVQGETRGGVRGEGVPAPNAGAVFRSPPGLAGAVPLGATERIIRLKQERFAPFELLFQPGAFKSSSERLEGPSLPDLIYGVVRSLESLQGSPSGSPPSSSSSSSSSHHPAAAAAAQGSAGGGGGAPVSQPSEKGGERSKSKDGARLDDLLSTSAPFFPSKIVLGGGLAACPNFPERLALEIRQRFPADWPVKLYVDRDPQVTAWRGASRVAADSAEFLLSSVSLAQYREWGANARLRVSNKQSNKHLSRHF